MNIVQEMHVCLIYDTFMGRILLNTDSSIITVFNKILRFRQQLFLQEFPDSLASVRFGKFRGEVAPKPKFSMFCVLFHIFNTVLKSNNIILKQIAWGTAKIVLKFQ